jgi:hypothetical protein
MIIPGETAAADDNAGRPYPAPLPVLQSSGPKSAENKN